MIDNAIHSTGADVTLTGDRSYTYHNTYKVYKQKDGLGDGFSAVVHHERRQCLLNRIAVEEQSK